MSRKPIKSLLLRGVNVTALVAGLATFVNPYGPGLQQWLLPIHFITRARPRAPI